MLTRRGVIGRWELRTGRAFDMRATIEGKIAATQADSKALVYQDTLALSVDAVDAVDPAWEIRARFMTLRPRESIPVQYDPSSGLTPITIPDGCYIADVMHLIIKSEGYVCYDRHDEGPTLGELSQYFTEFLYAPVAFVSLYKGSLKEELDDMAKQLRKVEIAIVSTSITDADQRGLIGNLVPLHLGEKVPIITVSLGMGRTGRRDEYLAEDIQNDAMRIAGDAGELVERMKVSGRRRSTGKVEELNILRRRLGDHLELEPSTTSSNMPDPNAAYSKLDGMFLQYKSQGMLDDAVSARFMSKR
jgi:hypothetical protein